MSIATIVSEQGDGRYTIEIDFGSGSRDQTVANIDAYIGRLNETLNEVIAKIAEYNQQVEDQIERLNAARDSYIALASVNPDADPTAFNFERRKLTLIYAARDPYVRRRKILEAEIATMQRKRTEFANLVMVETRGAWCTTYTLGATGEVATVDIPGDSNLILIAPQARGWQPSDGFLFERALCDPNQAFFNAAILAGWQSESPTYRRGVITGLDHDSSTADVDLDDATLTGQALDINKRTSHSAIPVVYLNCNSRAFKVGDRVVVEYVDREWSNARVIGFVDNPRACYALQWISQPVYNDIDTISDGETIPEAVAPLPPYPSGTLFKVLLGWHIQWSHESGTPPQLRQYLRSRTLPSYTWDYEDKPYTSRFASAQYQQVPDLWLDQSADYWTLASYSVRREAIPDDPFDPPRVIAYITPTWDIETPAYLYYDGAFERFEALDRETVTTTSDEYSCGIVDGGATDAELVAAFPPASFSPPEHDPTTIWPSVSYEFTGETGYGMPYAYTVTWETPDGESLLRTTTVDPESPD